MVFTIATICGPVIGGLAIVVFGLTVAGLAVALVRRSAGLAATVLPVSMVWLYFPLIPASLLMALQAAVDALWHRKRPDDSNLGVDIR